MLSIKHLKSWLMDRSSRPNIQFCISPTAKRSSPTGGTYLSELRSTEEAGAVCAASFKELKTTRMVVHILGDIVDCATNADPCRLFFVVLLQLFWGYFSIWLCAIHRNMQGLINKLLVGFTHFVWLAVVRLIRIFRLVSWGRHWKLVHHKLLLFIILLLFAVHN
jgi:hypothetical protein